MRRLITFPCAGETLVGSLDTAAGSTGLLIVSGGNEIRCGAHRGMALLAEHVAAAGYPVFRYDRRGIGDSTGINNGFSSAHQDLLAAAAAFRAQGQVTDIVGFGNCDAASTLALYGHEAGIDRLLLVNPWTVEDTDDLPPVAAIRATYRQRLTSIAAWRRLLRGDLDLYKAFNGVRKATRKPSQGLAKRVVAAVSGWGDAASVVLARGDATAQAYAAAARHLEAETFDTDSHSFARARDQQALRTFVLNRLAAQDGGG